MLRRAAAIALIIYFAAMIYAFFSMLLMPMPRRDAFDYPIADAPLSLLDY